MPDWDNILEPYLELKGLGAQSMLGCLALAFSSLFGLSIQITNDLVIEQAYIDLLGSFAAPYAISTMAWTFLSMHSITPMHPR